MIIQRESTRERVLKTLLTQEQCTINELAQAVDINPIRRC
jgi:predicted ArsR family transcriptional regulator